MHYEDDELDFNELVSTDTLDDTVSDFFQDDEYKEKEVVVDDDDVDEGIPIQFEKDKKNRNYVDKKKLSDEVIAWVKSRKEALANNQEIPIISDYIGRSIIAIARNQSRRHNWYNYTYKNEMIDDAILNVCKYLKNFDENIKTRSGEPNAFGYISLMVFNSFSARIKIEEKEQYYKLKTFVNSGEMRQMTGEYDENLVDVGVTDVNSLINDIYDKIYEFEAKMDARREKAKAKEQAKKVKVTLATLEDAFED